MSTLPATHIHTDCNEEQRKPINVGHLLQSEQNSLKHSHCCATIPSSSAYNSVIKDPDSLATATVSITDETSKPCCQKYCTAATVWCNTTCACHRNGVVCIVVICIIDRVDMLHYLYHLVTLEVRTVLCVLGSLYY